MWQWQKVQKLSRQKFVKNIRRERVLILHFLQNTYSFSGNHTFPTMLQSMTGFGKSTAENLQYKVTVETRSVNSKQADITVRLPGEVRSIEMDLRRKITSALHRGKIELFVTLEKVSQLGGIHIDTDLATTYWEEILRLHRHTNIPLPEDPMSLILRLPSVLLSTTDEEGDLELLSLVNQATSGALLAHQEFREQEGAALERKFRQNIETIRHLLEQISPYESERITQVKQRLEETLQSYTGIDYDSGRLEQEMIYYIEKLDITEEKIRLSNHLSYFLDTMQNEQKQGRKLGFITQEIGREINTLGSKAGHSEIQKIVVQMKDQLEQIKEQVLNIL